MTQNERDELKKHIGVGLGVGLGSLFGASSALSPYLQPVANPTTKTQKSIRKFMRINNIKNVDLHLGDRAKAVGAFASYKIGDIKPGVHVRNARSEAVILHELGHAKNWRPFYKKREAIGLPLMVVRGLSGKSGAVVGAVHAYKNPDSKIAPLYPLLWSSPTLVDESLASLRGAKHLIQQYGIGAGLRKAGITLPALFTYFAIPTATSAAIYYNQKKRGIR